METDFIILDLDQLRLASQEEGDRFWFTFSLIFHEMIHSGLKEPGVFLNVRRFSALSIRDMIKTGVTAGIDLGRIKEMILQREVACDNLYLSSLSLIEVLNVHVTEMIVEAIIDSTFLKEAFREAMGKIVDELIRERFKEYVKKVKRMTAELSGTPVEDIPDKFVREKVKDSWPRPPPSFEEDLVRTGGELMVYWMKGLYMSFDDAILDRDVNVREIYSRLESLGEIGFKLCIASLDIPLLREHNNLLFNVDDGMNPTKRLRLLEDTLYDIKSKKAERIEKLSVKEISDYVVEQSGIDVLDRKTALKELVEAGVIDYSYIELQEAETREQDLEQRWRAQVRKSIEWGQKMRESKATLEEALQSMVSFFNVDRPMGVVSNGIFNFLVVSRSEQWKYKWCLNELKKQVVSGMEVSNPLDGGCFKASKRLRKKVERATTLARRFELIPVPEWLLERFRETSKQIGRQLF